MKAAPFFRAAAILCLAAAAAVPLPAQTGATDQSGTNPQEGASASAIGETGDNTGSDTAPPGYPEGLKILYSGAQSFDAETIDAELAGLIDQSVVTSLEQPGYAVLRHSGETTTDATLEDLPPVENPLFEEAESLGAQAIVSLQYFRDGGRITLVARLYDSWSGRFITGGSRSGTIDLSLLTLIDLLLSDIRDSLAGEGPKLIADFGHEGTNLLSRGMVISSPDEGAVVSLEGAGQLGVVQNGTVALDYRPLVINQNVRFLIEKPGFYPAQFDMVVSAATPEPVLPKLYPMGRFGVMFNWDPIILASFGLSLKVYPVPDTFYVEAGYTFVSSSMRQNIGRDPDEIQVPFTYNHRIDVQTGVYLFFPPESLFRFRLGLGLGMAIFPGPKYDPELLRNLIVSIPITAIDLNLRPFTASLSFGAEFAVDIGGRMMYPAGLIRNFQPFRLSLGILL